MRARIYVTLKKTVLDPQGQTICRSLNSLGHSEISDVRQGKVFELEMKDLSRTEALAKLESIGKEVLANPVIEDYRVMVED
jgi:phosphoribosylformylglycinamidine synthase subunit PurS